LRPVTGKVTVDGNPLTKGMVRFIPDKEKGNTGTTESVGEIQADGTYTLYTNSKPGAPTGWYKVTVNASEVPDSSKPMTGKSLVDPKYSNAEHPLLSVEVVSSPSPGAYDLKVSSR